LRFILSFFQVFSSFFYKNMPEAIYPRYFNTSGPNRVTQHYTLMRPDLVVQGIGIVKKERYFTIWAPRQTGKSTYFRILAQALIAEGYLVCHINVEGKVDATEEFLCEYICEDIDKQIGIRLDSKNVNHLLMKISQFAQKTVLIIDEIEQVNPELFNKFMHTIRAYYHNREQHNLKSVVLVGVANITGIIQDNASPFNIADNFVVPYFTKQEVHELLEQHETESGQLFTDEIKDQIYHITAGQPGLVNGFGLRMSEVYPDKMQLEYADYLAVEDWYLYEAIDKNVSNIVNKAKTERAYIEGKQHFSVYDDRTRFLHTNGLLKKDSEGNIAFWVPLYKKCLQQVFYPRMNGEAQTIQGNLDIDDYFTADGFLNIDKIIRDYQAYANLRGFRYFTEREADGTPKGLREAALMYSFETYIQSFLQVVGGKSYLEAHVALGRSDLILNIRGTEFVIEGKLFHNITLFEKGKPQLAYYIKGLGLKEGVYLVFVSNLITNPKVVEAIEIIDGITITTYIVRYDLEKDFG
jgi:type II secretory pathway predicted ATPase ExeA